MYNELVMPYFDHCSLLLDTYIRILMWGIGACGLLQKFHSNAARVIGSVSCETRS